MTDQLYLGTPRFDAGDVPAGATPAQVWPALLARHGPAGAAARVSGPFAFALREPSGRCVLAVDRFAMHTLCWRLSERGFEFAARADELSGADAPLDAQALFDYLYFHVIPSPRTAYQGVHRVPPGHVVVFDAGKVTVMPFWRASFGPVTTDSFEALRDRFRHLLRQAVERELDGTRAACFLSGGTDSSTVAGMIGVASGRPAATYSIGFEAEGYDEMEFARTAARHFGTEHHEYYVTPEDVIAGVPEVAGWYDAPFGNASAVPALFCARQARTQGVTKLLAGDGGDELFGGNSRYATNKVFGIYQAVPAAVRRGLMEPFFGMGWVARTPGLKKGTGYIRQANMPLPDRTQVFNLLRRMGHDQVLTADFLRQVDVGSVERQQREVWAQASAENEIDRHLAYDWRYTLAEADLPKVRGTTTLAGLDVGFPMLDDDLLAFSMTLPAHYKLKGLRLRWFFKEALRGFLPDAILTKKKQGFGLPFGMWASRHPRLKEFAAEAVAGCAERGIVGRAFASDLVERKLPEVPYYYGTMVWILMMMEHWMRAKAPHFRLR